MKLNPIGSNMTEVEIGNKTVLFSYKTPVAYHETGVGFFKTSKYWSATTSRHINKWLSLAGFKGGMVHSIDQVDLDSLAA